MISLFKQAKFALALAFLSSGTMLTSLSAYDSCNTCCETPSCSRLYIGAFGGGIFSNSTNNSQLGTVFFLEGLGGPLVVNAKGRTKSTSSGFGGVQVGYEWFKNDCSDWSIATALELEGFWFSHNKKGHLFNDSTRLYESDFLDSYRLDTGVYLANAVFALNSRCLGGFSPYIGVGIGASRISLNNAKSFQAAPLEEDINHFNTRKNDSAWTFAAQAKAGLRYNFCNIVHLFAEYRYVFIDSSNYILGATSVPGHPVTSPWNFKVHNVNYNAAVIGVQFDL